MYHLNRNEGLEKSNKFRYTFHPNFKEKYTTSDRLTPHINFMRLQLDLNITTETGNRSVVDMTHYCDVTWALWRPKPSLPPLFFQQLIEGNINVSKIYVSKRDPTIPSWKAVKVLIIRSCHYNDVIMGAMHLKSPASRLFTQPFIQMQINDNIKAHRYWPLCREFTGDRWIPCTNGQ